MEVIELGNPFPLTNHINQKPPFVTEAIAFLLLSQKPRTVGQTRTLHKQLTGYLHFSSVSLVSLTLRPGQ